MSDMTVLFKKEFKEYNTFFYQDFNEIDYSNNDDELFNSATYWVPKNPPRGWVGNFTNIKGDSGVAKDEETYVKNYGNPLAESQLKRVLFVLEENEDKISFKVFRYVSMRGVGKKYFKVRKQIYFLTFNYKKKLFYTGESAFKRKQKLGFKCKINVPDIEHTSIMSELNYYFTVHERYDVIHTFLNKIIEKTNIKVSTNNFNTIQEKYYEIILKNSKIKYPNAFLKFSKMFAPTKDVRKYDANLVTWFMKKNNLKGVKIRQLLNNYNYLDIDGIVELYRFLGQDLFNKIKEEVFFTTEMYSVYNPVADGGIYYENIDSLITKKEKENILNILNETKSKNFLGTLRDHLRFKHKLLSYGEEVKIVAKNLEEFGQEHVEWSTLLESYSNGHVTRFYGEDSVLVEDPIYTSDDTYFPILLKTTEDYQGESANQHNCVRTYSEKAHCFIVSLRKGGKDGTDRATIEYTYTNNGLKRVQTLGKYNRMLTDEWIEAVDDLDKRLDYLFKKGFIKLPVMTKKYKNGRINRMFAKFKEYDETKSVYDIYPRWVNEINDEINNPFDLNYDYDELFIDLP